MPIYKIRGVDVDFPYEAYDCQIVYMEKVIQSLQERCNALLESPTGTGKTLCLLCATLAWRKSLGGFRTGSVKGVIDDDKLSQFPSESPYLPTIVYTSRTHSQIRQVIQELKRSNYRPKMVVIGSREQLCIHDKVSLLHGRAQNNACHLVCRKGAKHRCKHYSGVSEYMRHNPYLGDDPIDIEDLVNIGRKSGPCPYYLSRELHKTVDILFSPYNYLIDGGYRKSLAVDWKNSVLIFDEAHNLEGLCADAASFDLPSGILTACISEAKDCVDLAVSRRDKSNDKSRNPDNFAILRALLLKLEKRIAEVPIESKEFGFTKPGLYIYDLFSDLNVNHETASMLIGIIEEAVVLLEESMQQDDKHSSSICRLETMGDILRLIFKGRDNIHAKHYRLHVREVETRSSDGSKGNLSRTLSWWCFNPGIAMEEFSKLGVGSIILTSGTLSPLDSFAQELNLKFPIRLENPHVISSDQIWVGVVPAGPSGYPFNSSYHNRDSLEYKQDLGNAIVNFARIVPDGLLVFFPSYYILDRCIECWKNMVNSADSSTVWERICKYKRPVVEPRQTSLFNVSIEDYMSKLNDSSKLGAIFFAVCRGKVSEGLDFADRAGRAVVITGLPFATHADPKVRLKRDFLDEKACSDKEEGKRITGDEWYSQQASRAVNQAIGRVIRHRSDYGAIILCDERFAQSSRQSQISLWIQPHIKCYSRFGDTVFTLTRFFRNKGSGHMTKPKPVHSVNGGVVGERRTMQSLGKPFPVDEVQFDESISPSHEVKGGNIFSQLEEVTPANRSSLAPYEKTLQTMWTSTGNLLCSGKKLMIPGMGNILKSCCVVDLTNSSSSEEQIRRKIVAPCSTKKRKGSVTEYGVDLQKRHGQDYKSSSGFRHLHSEGIPVTSDLVEINNSTINGGSGGRSSRDDFVCQSEDGGSLRRSDTHFSFDKGKNSQLDPVPCYDAEMQGSTFLVQVREKLSSTEYKEFIGFMKALKSKAMKIGYVLQSISRLFSGPERLSLSERFKDFIPAKYHLLYDQYLAKDGTTSG